MYVFDGPENWIQINNWHLEKSIHLMFSTFPHIFVSPCDRRIKAICPRLTPLPLERHTFHIIIVVTGLSRNLAQKFWQPQKRDTTVLLASAELRRRHRSCVVFIPRG